MLIAQKKKFLISVIGAAVLFLGFLVGNFQKVNAGDEIECAVEPDGICKSHYESCILCSAFTSTCTVNADNLGDTLGNLTALNACEWTALSDPFTHKCKTGACPNSNAAIDPAGVGDPGLQKGDPCIVRILDGGSSVVSTGSLPLVDRGVWDDNELKCIRCTIYNESKIYGDSAGIYYDTVADVWNKAGDGQLDSACTGVVPACDEKNVGDNCGGTNTCSATGLCVAAAGLVLTASASPTAVALSGASKITFSVTKNGTPVSGATVSGIAVTAGTGNVSAASCTTAAAGTCTVTYFALAAATVATISATKASNGVDTDSGSASASVTVTSCSGADYSAYDADPYNVGDTIQLDGHNTNDFSLCIYDDSGSLKQEGNFCTAPTPKSITFVANSAGTWKGSAVPGCAPGTCPDPFNAASGCPGSTTVNAAPPACDNDGVCEPPGETIGGCPADCGGAGPVTASFCESALVASDLGKLCGSYTVQAADVAAPGGWCCANVNFVFFSATAQTDCQSSDPACAAGGGGGGAEICAGGADEDGDGDVDCADSDCAADPACISAASCGGPGMFISPLNYCNISDLLTAATSWILALVASIIILVLIIGGLMYISSAGDEERMRAAKNIILYAIIGLGIILISYSLITEVTDILKGP